MATLKHDQLNYSPSTIRKKFDFSHLFSTSAASFDQHVMFSGPCCISTLVHLTGRIIKRENFEAENSKIDLRRGFEIYIVDFKNKSK